MKILIGSRESRLAVAQSKELIKYLEKEHGELEVSLITMKTTGDKILDRSLDKIGGKGLFVKELDRSLEEGEIDISVHSLKDMPFEESDQFPIIAYSKREDARDVLVLPEGVDELDMSRPIGTSSLRRLLQLKKLYPEAKFKSIRGNVITRLQKLDNGEFGALVLAAAGLKRLGLENRISRYFEPHEIIPAAGQGILAVQGRCNTDYGYLSGFNSEKSKLEAIAERAYVRYLNGGCSSPVAAFAEISGENIFIRGLYYDKNIDRWCTGSVSGDKVNAASLGVSLAIELKKKLIDEASGTGKVWLVGAGPGDAELLTLKAKRVLDEAQVIVYDQLAGDDVLSMLPASAIKIDAGKHSGHHKMKQDEINYTLLENAKKGYRVVRLKGGDPFLFGRGGEELEYLMDNGIRCEVIPGISSAIAVPEYFGIPVTHRDFCSSVHIITGHKKSGKNADIDYKALVNTKGTLVFLMGVAALFDICQGLIDAGMDREMPAAVLERGTTASQKRTVLTLGGFLEKREGLKINTPAIIIVGRVCTLAEKLSWHGKLDLSGCKIIVTRPKELSGKLSLELRRRGAQVLELPAIEVSSKDDNYRLLECISNIESYQWVVLTSPTGCRLFFEEMQKSGKDLRCLYSVKFAVIGEGTENALKERGIYADAMPAVFDGESLGKELLKVCSKGDKILLPRTSNGNTLITEILGKRGDLVFDDIPLYDTLPCKSGIVNVQSVLDKKDTDFVIFTSASTVRGFREAAKDYRLENITAVCIGKQTARQAEAFGMKTYTAGKASIDSIIDLVVELNNMKIK